MTGFFPLLLHKLFYNLCFDGEILSFILQPLIFISKRCNNIYIYIYIYYISCQVCVQCLIYSFLYLTWQSFRLWFSSHMLISFDFHDENEGVYNLNFLVLSLMWLTKFSYGLVKLKNIIIILLSGHFHGRSLLLFVIVICQGI